MSRKIANKALMHPFSILRQVGFSPRLMQRLERYRSQQDKQGRVVSVLSWADGTWCALSLHCEKTGAVIVDEGQQAEAYEDARSMLQGGFLPLLSLRFDFHA
ncbi:hypothetical protein ACFFQ5_27690 [Pseudomonas brassicacearum]|uniref:Uncharacterized protein n=1 Tax=Pseudomonas beijingensis TaxID=2954101 RepID=A0ABY9F9Q7_9PSED|nr:MULTISPECIES: hypothetical protein [Pseudomonas]EJL00239.1 hypothetical protein Pchl3084_4771 [Pseudomonas chlororaphis subsp. aureofaciens 30-84]KAB0526887.1 hypothetical protein F7R20_10915 [Pseudomonas brassicacearum subsp. brassicacearum]NJP60570.1 hypothetical protein [Pseudomonas brassicacearum]WLH00346.1 hypothetical protein PSH92_23790 [Pseudomonas sp. FP2034]SDP88764.1 hypothetical protein SAMN04490180_3627 [Pseudomonas brassicacearum]